MRVDPIKAKLKPPGTKRSRLNCDVLLSISAFKVNLRRYTEVDCSFVDINMGCPIDGRGLHSFTFQLNLSRG